MTDTKQPDPNLDYELQKVVKRVDVLEPDSESEEELQEERDLETVATPAEQSKTNEKQPTTFRAKIFQLLEEPSSSKALKAAYVSAFLLATIFVFVVIFVVGSLPEYWTGSSKALQVLEIFAISVFTLEYFLRLVTAPVWYKWIIQPMNLLDLVAIAPFFIEIASEGNGEVLAAIRCIRLVRVFRVFKVGKRTENVQVLIRTAKSSTEGLSLLLFCIVLALILFSTCMFYAEQIGSYFDEEHEVWIRDDGTVSPFQSIVHSFWWCIATMTTVGYGDAYPVTWLGKLVGAATMIVGILVLAFPISVIGSNFNDEWDKLQEEKQRRKRLALMQRKGHSETKKPVKALVQEISVLQYDLGDELRKLRKEMREANKRYYQLTLKVTALQQHPDMHALLE